MLWQKQKKTIEKYHVPLRARCFFCKSLSISEDAVRVSPIVRSPWRRLGIGFMVIGESPATKHYLQSSSVPESKVELWFI